MNSTATLLFRAKRWKNDGPFTQGPLDLGGGKPLDDRQAQLYPSPGRPGAAPGLEYNQPSDERSWRAMIDLLHEVFA